jgi:ATP-dependent Clp protease ATP-binding subunit ClpA
MPFINDVLDANQQHNILAEEAASQACVQSRFAFDPEQIKAHLEANIVGQAVVIDALYRQLKVIKAGLMEAGRPLCVMLLVGDTGVGKTEIVRLLAQCIHGDIQGFCRVDMNTLSQSHYSAAITGAPPGYVGSKDNSTLINEEAILGSASRPGIVLFDEIEKAGQDVARSLMNIFDSGKLRLASGTRELCFSNCLIFMTSNIGSRQWLHAQNSFRRFRVDVLWPLFRNRNLPFRKQTHRKHIVDTAIRQHFDPEFINRIDSIELFEPLQIDHLDAIIQLEVQRINRHLVKKGIHFALDEQALALIRTHGFDVAFGARSIKRCFRNLVMVPLAEALLQAGATQRSGPTIVRFMAKVVDQGLVFQRVMD